MQTSNYSLSYNPDSIKVNWIYLLGACFLLRIIFPDISWYSFIAISISLHQFLFLFNSIGVTIPVRALFGALMCLQMLVGSTLAYNGLDQYQILERYMMQVPEEQYFSYAIPSVLAFIIALNISNKPVGEIIERDRIEQVIETNKNLPYILIGIGFAFSFFGSALSSGLGFIIYVLSNLKFIGAFLLVLQKGKLKVIPLIIVYSAIIVSSLREAMFHDLITWVIFLGAIFAIRTKPSPAIKVTFIVIFTIIVVIIQQLKGIYRSSLRQGDEAGLKTFATAFEQGKDNSDVFLLAGLAQSNVRINQGFIITHIMKTVPAQLPFSNGEELMVILEAAFLPRILAPNKLKAGDRTIFSKYSGLELLEGTSMGLSSLGDAYINFGVWGGCVFMFALGAFYNLVLYGFQKFSKNYPLLILLATLIFYFPIRPDSELQTNLGHVIKSIILIAILLQVFSKYFRVEKK